MSKNISADTNNMNDNTKDESEQIHNDNAKDSGYKYKGTWGENGPHFTVDNDGNMDVSGNDNDVLGSYNNNNRFIHVNLNDPNDLDNNLKDVTSITFKNKFVLPKDCTSIFSNFINLTSIKGLDNLDTSQVTNMSGMFASDNSLKSLDLSKFETSQVTDMGSMFSGDDALESLDLSSFETSKVTDMSFMFENISSLTSLDLSSFDTSKVRRINSMFENASSLTSLDLSSFDTSKVIKMNSMFWGCNKLLDGYLKLGPDTQLGPNNNQDKDVELQISPGNINNPSENSETPIRSEYVYDNESNDVLKNTDLVDGNEHPGTWTNKKYVLNNVKFIDNSNPNQNHGNQYIYLLSGKQNELQKTFKDINSEQLNKLNIPEGYVLDEKRNDDQLSNLDIGSTNEFNWYIRKSGDTGNSGDTNTGDTGNSGDTNTGDTGNSGNTNTGETNKPESSNGSNKASVTYIYPTKKMYIYNSMDFSKGKRIKMLKKQSRFNTSTLKVKKIKGTNRYQVLGTLINNQFHKYNKLGYITSNNKFSKYSYYKKSDNSKYIKVMRKKGAWIYKSNKFTKNNRAKHLKYGTKLKVKSTIKHKNLSRMKLSNGDFITSNKTFVNKIK